MQLTAFAQKKLGDLALGVAAWTMPSVYLALFASSPGENGSLASEVSGGSYARVALTAKMGAADTVTGIAISTSVVTFPAPSAAQGVIAWAGIVDASSAGNVLAYTPLGNPLVVNNGDPAISFDVGTIAVSIAGAISANATSYLMKKLVDHMLGKASWGGPSAIYHCLFASDPTIGGGLSSEVGVGGYVRQLLSGIMSAVDATSGLSSNASAIKYPDPAANWPSVNFSGIADAASAGTLLFSAQLPSPLSIAAGNAPALFPAGKITVSFG